MGALKQMLAAKPFRRRALPSNPTAGYGAAGSRLLRLALACHRFEGSIDLVRVA